MERIDAAEAKRLIDEEGARLIDVRERYEWDEVRIPGATLMPLSEFEGDPTALAPARLTIFQCAHGTRSVVAAELYEAAWVGVAAASMEGGIIAWNEAGLPVEAGAG